MCIEKKIHVMILGYITSQDQQHWSQTLSNVVQNRRFDYTWFRGEINSKCNSKL